MNLAWLVSAVLLVAHAAKVVEEVEDDGQVFFVQTRARRQGRARSEPEPDQAEISEEDGICANLEESDLERPIREALAGHPGEDGWCVFGARGIWASKCAVARRSGNLSSYAALGDQLQGPYLRIPKVTAPKRMQLPGGAQITVRDHVYPLDDLYCFALGWYALDRYQAVHNGTYVTEVSKRTCRTLQSAYPDISIKDFELQGDVNEMQLQLMLWSPEPMVMVNRSLIEGMRAHAAAKCAISNGHGPICDIASCAERGCPLPDGAIGYTARGDCPSVL